MVKVRRLVGRTGGWALGLAAALALVAACNGPAVTPGQTPAATPGAEFVITPTPAATPTPREVTSARDRITLVSAAEPGALGAFSAGCRGDEPSMACQDLASDPLTWMDGSTFEVVPLSGVESWSQEAPDRWRFQLRDGVTFHNGEPWDAEAASLGIEWHGDAATAGHGTGSYGSHGPLTAEVVDDLEVDVVCGTDCPILPRTTMSLKFQAPLWWAGAGEDERESTTVGLGPYQVVEWRRGVSVELRAFEDYRPNSSFDSQAPSIDTVFQVWNADALVRAAMVQTGEADLAFDIGFGQRHQVPQAVTGGSNQVYLLVADNIWHPELEKKAVREALNLAIDCEGLMASLYHGQQTCYGNISPRGTVGITPANSTAYPYDPDEARELLAEAEYDPANEVIIFTREGRVHMEVELAEAIVEQWMEVGVNATLRVMQEWQHAQVRRSGCGRLGANARDCAEHSPPPPLSTSSHFYAVSDSNETLDLERPLLLRGTCGGVNSRVCDLVSGFEDSLQDAVQTPPGPARTRKMEDLATIIHDEYWFVPLFEVATVYGLAADLNWTPRHEPRIRVNTMHFR